MGDLNRVELVTQVRLMLDSRTDVSDAQIIQWLDWALLHCGHPKVYLHPGLEDDETVVLVAGTNTYDLNIGVVLVRGVRNTAANSGYRLEPKSKLWIRERRQDLTGRPSYYVRESFTTTATRQLKLYPTPSAEYAGQELEVEEQIRPARFASGLGTSVSPLEAEWDEILVLGAAWRGWRDLGVAPMADRYKADFAAMINEMGGIDALEKLEDPRRFDVVAPERYSRF